MVWFSWYEANQWSPLTQKWSRDFPEGPSLNFNNKYICFKYWVDPYFLTRSNYFFALWCHHIGGQYSDQSETDFLGENDRKLKIRWKISYEDCWIAAETFLRLLCSTSIGSIVDIEKCLYYYCSGYRFRKYMIWQIFKRVKGKNCFDIKIWIQVTLILIDSLPKITAVKLSLWRRFLHVIDIKVMKKYKRVPGPRFPK